MNNPGALPVLPNPVLHPLGHLRARFQRFWMSRLTAKDSTTLTQNNIYILPTRAGFMLAITLMVLLVASINYQLNLGYLLTFLLAGSAAVGMHVCHGTLRGITMSLVAPDPQFVGANVPIPITLASRRKSPHHGIGLAQLGTDHWSWTDVPAQGSSKVQVSFTPERRGLHPLPMLTAETRFPLGTFRVWTVWRPAAQALIYPQPEAHPPPLPPGEPRSSGSASSRAHPTGEYDGVRAYRRGDALKLVVWKKTAKSDELVSRDASQVQQYELWLDLHQTGLPGNLEARLSRLCAWVLMADKRGLQYGLRLGGMDITPHSGEPHKRQCLQALALFGQASATVPTPSTQPHV